MQVYQKHYSVQNIPDVSACREMLTENPKFRGIILRLLAFVFGFVILKSILVSNSLFSFHHQMYSCRFFFFCLFLFFGSTGDYIVNEHPAGELSFTAVSASRFGHSPLCRAVKCCKNPHQEPKILPGRINPESRHEFRFWFSSLHPSFSIFQPRYL